MYKRTITYTDYDGNERTEDHYFNLSKAELTKWVTQEGDYTIDKVVSKLYEQRNAKEIMRIFEDLIYMSYGQKSVDGRRFEKTEEVKRNFMETEAYSQLFMELVTDASKAAEFVNNIMPQDLTEAVNKAFKDNPDSIPAEIKDYLPGKK